MSIFDDIRNDAEDGTPGPWIAEDYAENASVPLWFIVPHDYHGTVARLDYVGKAIGGIDANARRIARVPDLERIVLAAEKLAKAAELVTSDCAPTAWDWKRYSAARDAFRAAVEEAQ